MALRHLEAGEFFAFGPAISQEVIEVKIGDVRTTHPKAGSRIATATPIPSRLIGTTILVRVRSEHLEGYVGTTRVFEISRLVGKHHHRIDYHHVIHSLVRKPGAFAAYRYQDDLFPATTFRQAY